MDTPEKPLPLPPVPCSARIRADVFGWYDSADQDQPTHDPGRDAICPVCGISLSGDWPKVTTTSLMLMEAPERSYFFRAHQTCWKHDISQDERNAIEGALIDAEVARLKPNDQTQQLGGGN